MNGSIEGQMIIDEEIQQLEVSSSSGGGLCCEWRYDSYNDQMVTKCKESWPGYKSVEMKFCFNCGKEIKHVSCVWR